MRKKYIETSILKFLLERQKEELKDLEIEEETNMSDQDLIDETDKEMAKKNKKEEEELTLDDVVKEYLDYYERQKKNKQI